MIKLGLDIVMVRLNSCYGKIKMLDLKYCYNKIKCVL